jgi:hypothetical protein
VVVPFGHFCKPLGSARPIFLQQAVLCFPGYHPETFVDLAGRWLFEKVVFSLLVAFPESSRNFLDCGVFAKRNDPRSTNTDTTGNLSCLRKRRIPSKLHLPLVTSMMISRNIENGTVPSRPLTCFTSLPICRRRSPASLPEDTPAIAQTKAMASDLQETWFAARGVCIALESRNIAVPIS